MMLKEEQLTETLFIISCSASKNSRAEGDKRWVDVIRSEKYSKFQEFTSIREELLNFYSSIHSDVEAQKIYQGFKYQSPSRWRKAWQTNRKLSSSRICRAIYRYTGRLYEKLDNAVRRYLANGVINNVLIISALHGPTLPTDYLPYYDLTMGDLWKDGKKLKNKWPQWIKEYAGDVFKTFLSKFKEICVMVGKDYKPAARAIRDIAPNIKKYREMPSSGSQSTVIWGRELNRHLLTLIRSQK